MKKNKIVILIIVLTLIIVIGGLLLFKKNKDLSEKQIKIIDASYKCNKVKEIFYEDDNYIYSFPCEQSSATYVKFPNGNKMLVITALEEKKVTIDELIKAGLNINKDKK